MRRAMVLVALAGYAGEAPLAPDAGVGAPTPLASVAGEDPWCGPASLWLYDQPAQEGDRICFTGIGVVDLSAYWRRRCDYFGCRWVTWELERGSVWNGAARVTFRADVSAIFGGSATASFPIDPWQRSDWSVAPGHLIDLTLE